VSSKTELAPVAAGKSATVLKKEGGDQIRKNTRVSGWGRNRVGVAAGITSKKGHGERGGESKKIRADVINGT